MTGFSRASLESPLVYNHNPVNGFQTMLLLDQSNPERLAAAQQFNVDPRIHANDFLYHFLANHATLGSTCDTHYFKSAHENACKISSLISYYRQHSKIAEIPDAIDLLDFASGHGMLNRHFSNSLHFASVTACDIHSEAVRFNQEILGHKSFLSAEDPSNFSHPSPGVKYNVIIAISFFSHIPYANWEKWLRVLESLLLDGGILLFTTHGITSGICQGDDLIGKGVRYSFSSFSEQLDLDSSFYGTTYIHPSLVSEVTAKIRSLHAIEYRNGFFWEGNQDIYVYCKKSQNTVVYCVQ